MWGPTSHECLVVDWETDGVRSERYFVDVGFGSGQSNIPCVLLTLLMQGSNERAGFYWTTQTKPLRKRIASSAVPASLSLQPPSPSSPTLYPTTSSPVSPPSLLHPPTGPPSTPLPSSTPPHPISSSTTTTIPRTPRRRLRASLCARKCSRGDGEGVFIIGRGWGRRERRGSGPSWLLWGVGWPRRRRASSGLG